MTHPNPLVTVSLAGGVLMHDSDVTPDKTQFVVAIRGKIVPLAYIHLHKDEAAQWAAVLTKYAEATK